MTVKAIIFGFIVALLFGFEAHIAHRDLFVKEVSKQVVKISGDVFKSDYDGLVYFQTNTTSFSLIEDDDFHVAEYCGALERNVQYCQWHEIRNKHTRRVRNTTYTYYTYSYYKGWSHTQINSLFFNNRIYINPYVESIPELTMRKPVQTGAYMLDNTLGLHGKKVRLHPHNQQILQFDGSPMSKTFQYAGRGIFYREYERGILGKMLSIATFFDTDNADRFDWCTPGDTRVWFEYWAPESVSVVGLKIGNEITSKEIRGFRVGAASSKNVTVKDLLKANTSWFPVIMMWVMRVALVAYVIYEFYHNRNMVFPSLGFGIFLISIAHANQICDKLDKWHVTLGAATIAGLTGGFGHYLIEAN
jgi:hypothetical protein